jgi:hypothetical protein
MFDIHQAAFSDDGWDDELTPAYNDGIAEEFARAPEGTAAEEELGGLGWCHSFVYYGLSYLGKTPPEMSGADVNEIVFDIFPRKVSVEADRASNIIRELRAFWQFLGRQYELPNAEAIIRLLHGDAEQELEAALSDPSNFGMAKSMFMLGTQAGFDMTSQEGMNQFLLAYNQSLLASRASKPQPEVPYIEVPAEGSTRIERSPAARVGRNDPCPCGSGKKYKRCCGRTM